MYPHSLSCWRLFALLFASLAVARATGPAPGPAVLQGYEFAVPFTVGPIKADPTRNVVYVTDETDNRLLVINTDTGHQLYSVLIDDGTTLGELAVSIDDSKLYLSESSEDEIMVFSLPTMAQLPSIELGFPPESIAPAVNGRLFVAANSGGIQNTIVEVNTTTGAILQTFGTTENYYYPPLLRANFDGTNLYAGNQGISGMQSIYEYSISAAQASPATGYAYDSENMIDFTPDEPNGRIYVMNGGIYGVNVILTATDNYATVWPLTGAYGVGISFNSQSNVVFGAAGDPYSGDIREYNRSNGAPLADVVPGTDGFPIQDRGIAATANGNVFFVRSGADTGNNGVSAIGLVGPNPPELSLNPTINQTITFPKQPSLATGDTITLDATDNSGLPITYSVVSGPGTISGNVLTVTGAGKVVVAANQPGGGVDKPAPQVTQAITVTRDTQVIAPFNSIPAQNYGNASFAVTPPMASSGLPVTVTVRSGPARFSGGLLTLTGVGNVVLMATQTGNTNYSAAAPVATSFTVGKRLQTIGQFNPIAAQTYREAPFTITPPQATSGLPVTIKVLSGPASIAGDRVALKGAGTVQLVASQAGNADNAPATPVTTSFTVNPDSQTITAFAAIPTKTSTAAPFAIAVPRASSALPVSVTVVSGPATISGSRVTVTGAGTVVLAANQGGNGNYSAAPEVTTSFTVE